MRHDDIAYYYALRRVILSGILVVLVWVGLMIYTLCWPCTVN
jgi:hypothetical protein